MAIFKAEYLEHEMKRWMRPDAHHFVKPDWRRLVEPKSDAASLFSLCEKKFRPDQARVPAGNREGGQWTDEGGNVVGGPESAAKTPTRVAGRISQARAEECDFMHGQDLFICRATQSAECYKQAYVRYTNCQNGRPVPPLNF